MVAHWKLADALLTLACAFLLLSLAGCTTKPKTGLEGIDVGGFEDLDVHATATTGLIRGVVVDEAIRPLSGVHVVLQPVTKDFTTADNGLFFFSDLEPGTYFIQVSKPGYNATQTTTEVVAGVDEPAIVKVLLIADASLNPFVETLQFNGYLSFGAAIGITSVGTTINAQLSNALKDVSIWTVTFAEVPTWAQGELVWKQNQPAGGMLIWEMVVGNTNAFKGHRETTVSPALAYWNTTVLQAETDNVTNSDRGIAYRFFGGPHPAAGPGWPAPEEQCPTVDTGPVLGPRNPCKFGYGLTFQQAANAYVHHFYNFAPPEGWRFTKDGAPGLPK